MTKTLTTVAKTETAKELTTEVVDAIEETEAVILRARRLAHTGFRAYLGLFGKTYDFAKGRVEKRLAQLNELTGEREELMEDLVKRGETLEAQAIVAANDARAKVVELVAEGAERVRDIVPASSREDRVEELEAQVEKLNAKIRAASKTAKAKTTTTKKTVARKTAKAVKTAA